MFVWIKQIRLNVTVTLLYSNLFKMYHYLFEGD